MHGEIEIIVSGSKWLEHIVKHTKLTTPSYPNIIPIIVLLNGGRIKFYHYRVREPVLDLMKGNEV